MASAGRLKRRLLRQLVEENLELRRNQRLRRRRLRRPFRLPAWLAMLALLPAGLLASSYLVSPGSAGFGALAQRPVSALPVAALAAAGELAFRPAATAAGGANPAFATPPPPTVAPAVFPLAVRKIVLDPGHGGDNLGTHPSSELVEKELTLDIAQRLRDRLERDSFEVLMTRDDDVAVPLSERASFANRAGADLFVSVHVNWIADRAVRGVETYYLGPTDDPFLTELAAAENRDSGYAVADLRHLLDEIYVGVRQDSSRRLAAAVQGSLFHSLLEVNPHLANRGVKSAPFLVLAKTEMPAILAEVACLSNDEEAALLGKRLYRQYIAEALAKGIRDYTQTLENPSGKEALAP